MGWLEASWANVIILIVGVAVACVIVRTVIDGLPFHPPADWDVRELTRPAPGDHPDPRGEVPAPGPDQEATGGT
jgi:hypothetical protein